jgi:hypothetical protein
MRKLQFSIATPAAVAAFFLRALAGFFASAAEAWRREWRDFRGVE